MATTTLDDGTRVRCIVRSEAQVLVEHARGYMIHGINLPENAVVLDVGANIGVFSVYLAKQRTDIQIHAFEPVPPVYEVLEDNAKTLGDGRIFTYPYGVGSTSGEFEFVYFPRCPALSTAHPEMWDRDPDALTRAVRGNIEAAAQILWYAKLVPTWLAGPISGYLKSKQERHTCQIHPLSHFMKETQLERIDLLKVDCEGAEMEVLKGVDDASWPKIQQVVCEVHDIDGRLDECKSLLDRWGFNEIKTAVEEGLEETPLVNVYARRV